MRVPQDDLAELRDRVLAVATSAFDILVDLKAKGTEFKKRHNYPFFDEANAATYRAVTWSSGEKSPTHYKIVFGDEGGYDTLVPYTSIPGVEEYVSFVEALPDLRDFLWPARLRDVFKKTFLTIAAMDLPLEIIERHIHMRGWEIDPDALETYYSEMSAWWLCETLPVKLMVPVLGVAFETDSLEFGEGVELRRLTDAEQLARWPGARLNQHRGLVEMATHALLVSGWNLTVPDYPGSMAIGEPPENVAAVERFFAALAAVTDAPSGYIQILTVPDGWAPGYTADLPSLEVTSLINDRYSTRLEPAGEPLDVIDSARLTELANSYAAQASNKPAQLAAERLVSAERRASEADRIVDLCIGLEALLSDPKGETTYKIAVRGSVLLAHCGIPNAFEFYRALKRIYGFRSAIVHGSSDSSKDSVTICGVLYRSEDIARVVLRRLLRARVLEPALTPEQIDNTVLALAIDGLAATVAASLAESAQGAGKSDDWLSALPHASP
ncbi:hypothetical protein [Ornithinimicrobium sp. LYQ103]|uniref:hypothetical protein n=1 Tax=Ornithinimicrobium sp. LYQ103 TaxID=3378796 RepID=UPI003852F164